MNLADRLAGRTGYDQYYRRVKLLLNRPGTKVSGLVTLTVFTVVGFLIFAILPTFKTIAALKREIEDARNVEAKLQQKIHSLNQAESLYGQIVADLGLINRLLPAGPEWERFAWQLYWLADKNGLTLLSGTFDQAEKDFVPVSLSLKGSYPQIKTFVDDLNRLDRLIAVEELTISGKNRLQSDGRLTANLKLKAFYLPSL